MAQEESSIKRNASANRYWKNGSRVRNCGEKRQPRELASDKVDVIVAKREGSVQIFFGESLRYPPRNGDSQSPP